MKKLLITLLAMLLMTLPAQAEWDDHVLLEDKDCGGCTALTGDVRLVVVMVSVDDHPWPVGAQLQMMQEVQQGVTLLEKEAADWGVSLDLQPEWHEATAATSVPMDDGDEPWADAVLASVEGLHGRTDARYADTPIIFCLSSTGRAFAHTEWARSEAEFAFLYVGDDEAVLRHELLHLYGAEDYYIQADIMAAAEALCPDSIMLDSLTANRVDPLTAYMIGWTEELDEAAEDFLSMTAHVTDEMLHDARAEDQATGYRIVTWENGVYSGMLVDGVEHGWGECRWNNGDVYVGDWVWGERTGKGTYLWPDGSSYAGDFVKGLHHGKGTYTWADGTVYTGDFVDGVRTGFGVMTWPNGTTYTGQFLLNAYHGKGMLVWADGTVYTGDFNMDALTGQGMYTWPDGATYTGEVKDGDFHGKGTYTWPNGQSYTGEFVNDTMANGQALTVWVDGTTYVGDIADGNPNGKGTLIRPDGSVYTGGVANGAKDGQGLWLMTDGTVYLGDFSGDVRHGDGTQITPNGAVCTGDFSNGYLHGQGTQILPDGTRYTGGFHCGLYHGEGTLVSPEGGVTVGVWEYGDFTTVSD